MARDMLVAMRDHAPHHRNHSVYAPWSSPTEDASVRGTCTASRFQPMHNLPRSSEGMTLHLPSKARTRPLVRNRASADHRQCHGAAAPPVSMTEPIWQRPDRTQLHRTWHPPSRPPISQHMCGSANTLGTEKLLPLQRLVTSVATPPQGGRVHMGAPAHGPDLASLRDARSSASSYAESKSSLCASTPGPRRAHSLLSMPGKGRSWFRRLRRRSSNDTCARSPMDIAATPLEIDTLPRRQELP